VAFPLWAATTGSVFFRISSAFIIFRKRGFSRLLGDPYCCPDSRCAAPPLPPPLVDWPLLPSALAPSAGTGKPNNRGYPSGAGAGKGFRPRAASRAGKSRLRWYARGWVNALLPALTRPAAISKLIGTSILINPIESLAGMSQYTSTPIPNYME
jgi:hypothetical protein